MARKKNYSFEKNMRARAKAEKKAAKKEAKEAQKAAKAEGGEVTTDDDIFYGDPAELQGLPPRFVTEPAEPAEPPTDPERD